MLRYRLPCLLLLATLPLIALADAPAEVFEYRIHKDTTGTSLGYTRTVHGPYPFDKTYAELSPAQQAHLKDEYDDLGPNDEPPFPANGLGEVESRMFRMIDKLPDANPDFMGKILALLRVEPNGSVSAVSFYKGPDNGAMRNLIAGVLMQVPFKPGMRAGKAVPMDYLFEAGISECSTSQSSSVKERCK